MKYPIIYLKGLLLLTIFITIVPNNVFSQYAEIEYYTELCGCVAKFDSTQYTRQQLQNTIDYLWWMPNIDTDATGLKDVKSAEELINDLKTECMQKIERLQTLDFVNDTFWQKLKNEIIEYYISTCRLKEYTMLAYDNPKILLEYDLVDSTCMYYRDALIKGGEAMLKAWAKLNEVLKSNNGYPDQLQREFEEKYNSDNRLTYAKEAIMVFGWWNNANHLLPHIDFSYNYREEFEKFLNNVECECDEP